MTLITARLPFLASPEMLLAGKTVREPAVSGREPYPREFE